MFKKKKSIIFYPRSCSRGGSGVGEENLDCKCFGFKEESIGIGAWNSKCYGIPYDCEKTIMTGNI